MADLAEKMQIRVWKQRTVLNSVGVVQVRNAGIDRHGVWKFYNLIQRARLE